MKKLLPASLLLVAAFQLVQAQGRVPPRASAASVTGTYSFQRPDAENTLRARQLPGGRVKIYIYASWIGSVEMGNVRTGEVRATLALRNNVAVYESGQCRITIRFTRRRAIVTQNENDCDFGLNVLATGSYTKRSSRAPKFDF